MSYLLAGLVLLVFLVWRGRVGQVVKGSWRAAAGILSIFLIVAAAFEGLRGGVISAGVLVLLSAVLLGTARWPRARKAPAAATGDGMSLAEARATLGVEPGASAAEIRAAHARLIRVAHPDAGGTTGLAAQLNAARDRLLKG
jgi:hypothetical protein